MDEFRSALFVLPLAGLLALVVWRALADPVLHGDSAGLVRGAQGIVECVRDGRFVHCDRHGSVSYWALLQHLPAVPLRAAGLSQTATLRVLIAIDAGAFLATVAGVWILAARRFPVWGPLLAAAVATSPLLWYTTSAFSEALAALAILGAIGAVLTVRRPWLIALAVAVACIGKETNPPFVLALACLCLLAIPAQSRRRCTLGIAAGTALGIAMSGAFDIFRYGAVVATPYFEQARYPMPAGTDRNFFAALWFAPNAGLVWFWPAAVGVLVLCAVATVGRRRDRSAYAPWAALGVLVVAVAGLARWWAPFGWIAWGPRLLLPLVPAVLVVAAVVPGAATARLAARVVHSRWACALAAGTSLAALPQVAIVWALPAFTRWWAPTGVCADAHMPGSPGRYYACVRYRAWRQSLVLWHALEGLQAPGGLAAGLCAVGAVFGCVALARRAAVRERAGHAFG